MTDPVPSKDVLSCPFCGKEAKVYGVNLVGCSDTVGCGAQVDWGHFYGPDPVIAAWNKRAAGNAEIEHLRRENVRWENAHKILLAENERLRKQVDELSIHAEKWVKRALGGSFTCLGGCGVEVPTKDGYCSACFLKARRLQKLETAWLEIFGERDAENAAKWVADLLWAARPAHEREAPHCPNCSCGMEK